MQLAGKRIILGVSGSIAAYKSVLLLRLLQQAGAEVQVVMTEAATRFVAPLTFATLSQRSVFHQLWSDAVGQGPDPDWSKHVQLGHWADLLVVAPATANTLAKLAHGLCDDALQAVLLSSACPVLLAPAMDREMYRHPATQHNLTLLRQRGVTILDSDIGYLASGLQGQGRMPEPEVIFAAIESQLVPQPSSLRGKRVLITAGPTQEALDPVRYLSNHSSGKMGIALAEQAAALGAQVTLVLGPTALRPASPGIEVQPVVSAQAMFEAVEAVRADQDVLIYAAAVADFRPAAATEQKIKKADGQTELVLKLVPTPDLLAHAGAHKLPHQVVVGFALETHDALAHAEAKLVRKRADLLVLNRQGDPGAGFGADTNQVTLLRPGHEPLALPLAPKAQVAQQILAVVAERLSSAAIAHA